MSFIWQSFPDGGSLLLLALAVADFADDAGERIFPSVATLAAKVRLSERSVQYLLRKLQTMGWLELVSKGGGRSRTCLYRIPVARLQRLHPSLDQRRKRQQKTVQRADRKGAVTDAPDSPLNRQSTEQKGETATAGNARHRPTTFDPQHVAEHLARLKASLNKSKK